MFHYTQHNPPPPHLRNNFLKEGEKKENPTPCHYKPLWRKEENKYQILPLSSP
jgi:hypothetical protein